MPESMTTTAAEPSATDVYAAHVARARELACQRGLGNVDIVAADADAPHCPRARSTWCTPVPCWSTFPEPAEILAEMVRQ
jgi:hypothetical protein